MIQKLDIDQKVSITSGYLKISFGVEFFIAYVTQEPLDTNTMGHLMSLQMAVLFKRFFAKFATILPLVRVNVQMLFQAAGMPEANYFERIINR